MQLRENERSHDLQMIFKGKHEQAARPSTGGLRAGLRRTRESLLGGLGRLIAGKDRLDPKTLEEIEDLLLSSDVGIEATRRLVTELKEGRHCHPTLDPTTRLREELVALLRTVERPLEIASTAERPFVMLVVGVNGSGKTTTIGKIAYLLKRRGLSVALAAGDTFRAAAVEQLKAWGERNEIAVTAQETGADSASVIYDALVSGRTRGIDVLIADTAGRLHTKSNFMEELKKVKRVLQKLDPLAPHEVMLVIDATSGQNVLNQVAQFHQAVGVTGITITKLDGTAKGGILLALACGWPIAVRYVGMGEGLEDLAPFEAEPFVDALLGADE